MEQEISSFDWLPAGWKVESRVRRNGKKDKCYTDPSNEHKFYSKPEVLRYLKSAGTNVEEPTKKGSKNRSAINVVVKDAVAEGLPAGWIKEIRVTKKGHKIRRDTYYIEPETGNLFRSMKEVSRYLDTRKMSKGLSEPQEQEPVKSPVETGEGSANKKAHEVDTENANDKAAEEAPATDHANESKFDDLEQKETEEKSSASISPVLEDDLQEKLPQGKSLEMSETESNRKKNLKKKRGPELPRRTSKRLAGVPIKLPLEQIVHKQVHQATTTDIIEKEANCANNCQETQDSKDSDENVKMLRTGNEADKKQENLDASSPGDVASHEEQAKIDEKQERPMDLSLNDLWKDPCIEFAIKTLTGAIPIVNENKVAKDPGVSVDLPGAVAGNQDLPFGDIWADPCIEFTVKTLTSDVPTGSFDYNEKSPASVSKDFHKQL